ncbi:hypothetical protein EJ08DRAFT_659215 [Tothia fuscella]|uniref:Uncharacterized protein n=1 Tax=Tothia fuscella TaxID=1048955 RepID=A0A9P4U0S4_9PEZI|nr:hypothetical protein EJ08DRAFT_659215 [Tothia fuscella]
MRTHAKNTEKQQLSERYKKKYPDNAKPKKKHRRRSYIPLISSDDENNHESDNSIENEDPSDHDIGLEDDKHPSSSSLRPFGQQAAALPSHRQLKHVNSIDRHLHHSTSKDTDVAATGTPPSSIVFTTSVFKAPTKDRQSLANLARIRIPKGPAARSITSYNTVRQSLPNLAKQRVPGPPSTTFGLQPQARIQETTLFVPQGKRASLLRASPPPQHKRQRTADVQSRQPYDNYSGSDIAQPSLTQLSHLEIPQPELTFDRLQSSPPLPGEHSQTRERERGRHAAEAQSQSSDDFLPATKRRVVQSRLPHSPHPQDSNPSSATRPQTRSTTDIDKKDAIFAEFRDEWYAACQKSNTTTANFMRRFIPDIQNWKAGESFISTNKKFYHEVYATCMVNSEYNTVTMGNVRTKIVHKHAALGNYYLWYGEVNAISCGVVFLA